MLEPNNLRSIAAAESEIPVITGKSPAADRIVRAA